ncbi:DUF3140 domain-containing protein [Streptantibioticus parmotrematis]|uniref:DUF3140 domain-containing protein n=1 Tax=Streptantibioticus parmotrematis TaxID=2873249 RepID=UPI0033CD104D
MTGIPALEMDALWDEFHTVVNMTSAELSAWLRTDASGERTEPLPEDLRPELGERVVEILAKRRTDLTDADVATMYEVVDTVRRERGDDAQLEPRAGDPAWRHRLMSVGHDPLASERKVT